MFETIVEFIRWLFGIGNHYEVHVVVPGDTLSGISQKRFHTAARWPSIAALNNLKHPYTIYPGQVLKLPERNAQPRKGL